MKSDAFDWGVDRPLLLDHPGRNIVHRMVGDTLNQRAKTHNFNPGFFQQQFNKLKERYSKQEEVD